MHELTVAAGEAVAYLAERISPCKMTEEHCYELGPGSEAFSVMLNTMFYDKFLKVDTRNLTKYLTEQTRNL